MENDTNAYDSSWLLSMICTLLDERVSTTTA